MNSDAKSSPSSDPLGLASTSGDAARPKFLEAIELLRKASRYANDTNRDRWDFAVEASELEKTGLTATDFRWLTCRGFVRHGCELTETGSESRTFRESTGLNYERNTCFILTEAGLEFANSILDRSQALCDLFAQRATPPVSPAEDGNSQSLLPHWDCDSRELRYQGRLVKQFKVPSPNQEIVIMSFEEEGWPTCIDDPLPSQAGRDPKQRLHDTIRSLNRNQKNCMLRFKGNGTGQGILWQAVTDPCSEEEDRR